MIMFVNPYAFAAPAPTTSYGNPLGQGDRRGSLGVTSSAAGVVENIIDGLITVIMNWTGTSALHNFTFDFGTARVIDEATWYQDATDTHSTWIWEGSNTDATSGFAQIGSSFVLGGATSQVHDVLHGNVTAYRWYRLRKTGAGLIAGNSDPVEIEFKIDAGP